MTNSKEGKIEGLNMEDLGEMVAWLFIIDYYHEINAWFYHKMTNG